MTIENNVFYRAIKRGKNVIFSSNIKKRILFIYAMISNDEIKMLGEKKSSKNVGKCLT